MPIADLSSVLNIQNETGEIETGVVILGVPYAASLIGLIVWLA